MTQRTPLQMAVVRYHRVAQEAGYRAARATALARPTPRFDAFMAAFAPTCTTDDGRALLEIFVTHRVIAQHFEDSLPERCTWGGRVKAADRMDYFGPTFHKAFRQVDIVEGDKGATDMRVWHLLRDCDTAFWRIAHDIVMPTPTAWKRLQGAAHG